MTVTYNMQQRVIKQFHIKNLKTGKKDIQRATEKQEIKLPVMCQVFSKKLLENFKYYIVRFR